jgi:hypothetical protein
VKRVLLGLWIVAGALGAAEDGGQLMPTNLPSAA